MTTAPLLKRTKAILFDFILLVVMAYGLSILITDIDGEKNAGFALFSILLLYEPILVSLSGKTLGHLLAGITVKKATNPTRNINFINALLRFLAKGLLGWLSILFMTLSSDKRALHDIVGGAVVLESKNRN